MVPVDVQGITEEVLGVIFKVLVVLGKVLGVNEYFPLDTGQFQQLCKEVQVIHEETQILTMVFEVLR